ncbi:hypothetical protein HDU96_002154 [Phlyctochytrium bullatum]|nr:hypothetical protein HDU96_002154 [Phlyctochytrium bullatum]
MAHSGQKINGPFFRCNRYVFQPQTAPILPRCFLKQPRGAGFTAFFGTTGPLRIPGTFTGGSRGGSATVSTVEGCMATCQAFPGCRYVEVIPSGPDFICTPIGYGDNLGSTRRFAFVKGEPFTDTTRSTSTTTTTSSTTTSSTTTTTTSSTLSTTTTSASTTTTTSTSSTTTTTTSSSTTSSLTSLLSTLTTDTTTTTTTTTTAPTTIPTSTDDTITITSTLPPDPSAPASNRPLLIGLAVAGSLVGALLIAALVTFFVRTSRRKERLETSGGDGGGVDGGATMPWRRSGVFSAGAGVGAASLVAGDGAAGKEGEGMTQTQTQTVARPPVAMGTVGRPPFAANGSQYTDTLAASYASSFAATSGGSAAGGVQLEAFTVEQYLAAGWTMEQINLYNPPILPSQPGTQ